MSHLLDVGSFLWTVVALGLVLALIWGGQSLLMARRRMMRPGGERRVQRLRLAETIALDSRRRLHLVQCDGRAVLIQTGGAQDLVVGWLAPTPGEGA